MVATLAICREVERSLCESEVGTKGFLHGFYKYSDVSSSEDENLQEPNGGGTAVVTSYTTATTTKEEPDSILTPNGITQIGVFSCNNSDKVVFDIDGEGSDIQCTVCNGSIKATAKGGDAIGVTVIDKVSEIEEMVLVYSMLKITRLSPGSYFDEHDILYTLRNGEPLASFSSKVKGTTLKEFIDKCYSGKDDIKTPSKKKSVKKSGKGQKGGNKGKQKQQQQQHVANGWNKHNYLGVNKSKNDLFVQDKKGNDVLIMRPFVVSKRDCNSEESSGIGVQVDFEVQPSGNVFFVPAFVYCKKSIAIENLTNEMTNSLKCTFEKMKAKSQASYLVSAPFQPDTWRLPFVMLSVELTLDPSNIFKGNRLLWSASSKSEELQVDDIWSEITKVQNEDESVEFRKRLLKFLGLEHRPSPVLRLCASLAVQSKAGPSSPLRNVHQGPYGKHHGVTGATEYYLEGDYEYYHYMMGKYDDSGWGCAYRSLQTIVSWYNLNHYSPKTVPTHQEIQQTLLDMDVMDHKFRVGCKQWIGSQEVSWLLDKFIGASSKFIICSRGSEIVENARQLVQHFQTQGSPVLIAGGNLALTLLGIAYNELSGEAKFLILDPHYTGVDDLKTIQGKTLSLEGYKAIPCSWRDSSAFSDRSNYNLCLPQKLNVV